MIASLSGVIQEIAEDELVVELGGLGFRVAVPLNRLEAPVRIGKSIFLHTSLIVREDSLSLYGFPSSEERELFDLLLQVSGVGPRLALATLTHLSPETFRQAVSADQAGALAQVPGIGRKTAEKIIFHLKDRIGREFVEASPVGEADAEVVAVLTNLGYSVVEAQSAVRSIPDEVEDEVEDRVRAALRYFATP